MDKRIKSLLFWFIVSSCLLLMGCGTLSQVFPGIKQSPTRTPTGVGGILLPDDPVGHPCEGVLGTLELQVLVGPSEAVGLTPFSIGEIPFSVIEEGGAYTVMGGGQLNSYNDILTAPWGTYSVNFEGDLAVTGECNSVNEAAFLNLIVDMTGEQNVEIVYGGQELNIPWSGKVQIQAALPVEEGALQTGEGWTLVLHLK